MASWNEKEMLSGVVKVALQIKQHLFTQIFRELNCVPCVGFCILSKTRLSQKLLICVNICDIRIEGYEVRFAKNYEYSMQIP